LKFYIKTSLLLFISSFLFESNKYLIQLSTFAEQTPLQRCFFYTLQIKKSPKALSQRLYEKGPTKQCVSCKEQESEQGS